MYQKMKEYVAQYRMIEPGDIVIAGISGGGDSMAMLSLLRLYQQEVPFFLCAVHVHHGIRGAEADRDEELVKKVCAQWQIPFYSYHYAVPELAKEYKMGLEETGRLVRREAFSLGTKAFLEILQEPERGGRVRIALAHNENDVAETLLHNLCRGTGLKGLASIPPVKDQVIRPILCLKKEEILCYLKTEKIPYETDSTNLTDLYTRNKIRHKVLPLLEQEMNAESIRHMAETALMVGQAEAYLSRQGKKLAETYVKPQGENLFLPDKFWKEEPVVASYGLLQLFEKLAGKRKDFTSSHVKSVENLCSLQVGRKIQLPYGLMAQRTYGGILLGKVQSSEKKAQMDPKKQFIGKIILNEGQKIEEKTYTKWLDYDKIKNDLSIRTRQPGDFLVVDSKGSRKKLNRYFIDEKIPAQERDQILVLAMGSEILWVVGGRISENYKITPKTRRILEIQYQGGKKDHE